MGSKSTKQPATGQKLPAPAPENRPEVTPARSSWRLPMFLIVLGAAGMTLVYNSRLWTVLFDDEASLGSVGTVLRERGGVRLRSGGSLVWTDLGGSEHIVSFGDAIFTGRDGDARLLLQDGSLTQVSPNSLVVVDYADKTTKSSLYSKLLAPVIEQEKKPLALKVERGGVSVQSGKSPMEIQAQEKKYKVPPDQAAPVEVEVDPDNHQEPVKFSSEKADEVKVSLFDRVGEQAVQIKKVAKKEKPKQENATGRNGPALSGDELKEFQNQRYRKVAELRNHVVIYDHPGLFASVGAVALFFLYELIATIRNRIKRARAKALKQKNAA